MSCDIGEALLILQAFSHFTYITTHSPNLTSLYLRHRSFYNPSVASPTSQFILQASFHFSYVASSSLNSPGELPMVFFFFFAPPMKTLKSRSWLSYPLLSYLCSVFNWYWLTVQCMSWMWYIGVWNEIEEFWCSWRLFFNFLGILRKAIWPNSRSSVSTSRCINIVRCRTCGWRRTCGSNASWFWVCWT